MLKNKYIIWFIPKFIVNLCIINFIKFYYGRNLERN